MRRILITGGAGYIGSHTAKQLARAGHRVTTLDNLSTGFAGAVLQGPLIRGDAGDPRLLARVLDEHRIDTIMHFAALTVVPDSLRHPLRYYDNNTSQARTLIDAALRHGVKHLVLSSTAAVYGVPPDGRCSEDTPTAPASPYGHSKLMAEQMLKDACAASGLRYGILRYFNVGGCDPDGDIGQSTRNASLLIKAACEAALGMRDAVSLFGTDYPTPDGTGVRDYLHVCDLADAHRLLLDHLAGGGRSLTLNCGYGVGYSVQEVLQAVQRAVDRPLPVRIAPRRAGDPPSVVADASRLRALGWTPRFATLDTIVQSTLAWTRRQRDGEVRDGRARQRRTG